MAKQEGEASEKSQLLVAEDIMKMLKISRSKVHDLTFQKRNPLPSVRIGKARRFPRDKVMSWMGSLEQ